ncbi:MAG: transcriptional regulator [Firmicutes bacterium HGW-Firmicutes-9]|nr:MAG: transcriptional regulator [Firmicutes bacterium HGW-Firmicutes-9]
MTTQGIERFLDEEGRLKQWPAKHGPREEVFAYLAQKFELGRDYSEHEVNDILSTWHTFGDLFILRRGLIESEWLLRMRDGSRYWRNPEKKETAE